MGNCLVTKLLGSVSNDNMLRIGEMRIGFIKTNTQNAYTQGLRLICDKPIKIEIVGNGYFTDSQLQTNKGKSIIVNDTTDIYVSTETKEIAILNKYDLKSIMAVSGKSSEKSKSLDIEFLKYSLFMQTLMLYNWKLNGDVSSIKDLTDLTILNLTNSSISGDISSFSNLTKLTNLQCQYNNKVKGDIASLSKLTLLTDLALSGVNGDLANLSNMNKLHTLLLPNSSIIGNLAVLSKNLTMASFEYNTSTKLTWSSRPSDAYIISILGNAKMENIDQMLIDQAECQTPSVDSSKKIIKVLGTRTSASDAAVTTLQQKGYTVSITPA